MYGRYGDFDLCVHQGVRGLGGGRQLDDNLCGGDGNVCGLVWVSAAGATSDFVLTTTDGMTPETFGTAIRGTACGTSAALSRL
jgi:hypothetical protein